VISAVVALASRLPRGLSVPLPPVVTRAADNREDRVDVLQAGVGGRARVRIGGQPSQAATVLGLAAATVHRRGGETARGAGGATARGLGVAAPPRPVAGKVRDRAAATDHGQAAARASDVIAGRDLPQAGRPSEIPPVATVQVAGTVGRHGTVLAGLCGH
jgi:hypothetical protein